MKMHMTPKKPVNGINGCKIYKNAKITWFDKSTHTEYTGTATDIHPLSNTLLFHEINNKFEQHVNAYDCKPIN